MSKQFKNSEPKSQCPEEEEDIGKTGSLNKSQKRKISNLQPNCSSSGSCSNITPINSFTLNTNDSSSNPTSEQQCNEDMDESASEQLQNDDCNKDTISATLKETTSESNSIFPKADPQDDEESINADDTCPICLGTVTEPCAVELCLHRFCFVCLKRWAQMNNNCPLCKNVFSKILYDIKGDANYKEYIVPKTKLACRRSFIIISSGIPTATVTEIHSVTYRRRRYTDDLWVRFPRNSQIRMSSPALYREQEGLTHRLIPWLRRELKALKAPPHLLISILDNLKSHHILSRQFRSAVRPFLKYRTEQFQHEFNCFAHSSYDMYGYDISNANNYGSSFSRVEPPTSVYIDDDESSVEIDLTREDQTSPADDSESSQDVAVCRGQPSRSLGNSYDSNHCCQHERMRRNVFGAKNRLSFHTHRSGEITLSSDTDSEVSPSSYYNTVSKKEKNRSTPHPRPSTYVENIVISSSEDEPQSSIIRRRESKKKAKRVKLNRDSPFHNGNSSGTSRNREPKDHPSRIKSSKKSKSERSNSREHK